MDPVGDFLESIESSHSSEYEFEKFSTGTMNLQVSACVAVSLQFQGVCLSKRRPSSFTIHLCLTISTAI